MQFTRAREQTDELYEKIKCRKIGLASVVCVDGIEFGKVIPEWEPDWVVFEHPELLGTTTSFTETDPQAVQEFQELVDERSPKRGSSSAAEYHR